MSIQKMLAIFIFLKTKKAKLLEASKVANVSRVCVLK